MPAPTNTLSTEQLAQVLGLIRGADSVELKLSVPDEDRGSAVAALDLDPLDAQIRQVVFFDTPDLLLNGHGVVVRARRVQGKTGDAIVKLRPLVPDEIPADIRRAAGFGVEVDAMPGGFVCSGTMKGEVDNGLVRDVIAGRQPVRKLFTKAQRALYARYAPDGVELDDLSALGPINVLKLKLTPPDFGRRLVAELWLYPDGSRILELSTKCTTSESFEVAAQPRVPRRPRDRPARRAADQDACGAGVLLPGTLRGEHTCLNVHRDRRKPAMTKMKRKEYEAELATLHAELVALQEWVKANGSKVCDRVRRARQRRQGRHHQGHHRPGEPTGVPGRGPADADRPGEVADVHPAVHPTPPGRR